MSALVPYEPKPLMRRVGDAWRALWGKSLADTSLDFPEEYQPGVSQVPGVVVSAAYDPHQALSAYGAFPWVRVCIDAIGSDLAMLPRKVVLGFGDDAEEIPDHPFHTLMLAPNPAAGTSRELYYKERILDWGCAGNAMRLVAGVERGEPTGLIRLHPDETNPEPNGMGGIASWVSNGLGAAYSAEEVLHDRRVAWEGGDRMLLGESPIRTLDRALTTGMHAEIRASKMSASGQPQAILRPDPNDSTFAGATMTDDQKRKMRTSIESALTRYGSGLLVMDRGFLLEKLGFTPREMEFADTLFRVRDETLAVFGVTRTRAGLPEANYATARQQARTYWESRMGDAAMLDAQDTRLARMFTVWARRNLGQGWAQKLGSLRVVTDFSQVEALQESRTERVQRVSVHIMNLSSALGATEAARVAYKEEGFDQIAGLIAEADQQPQPAADPAAEEAARAVGNLDGLRTWTRQGPALVVVPDEDTSDDPTEPESKDADATEATRTAMWEAFIRRTHAPLERSFQQAMYRALRQQAQQLAGRLPDALAELRSFEGAKTKVLSADDVAELLNLAESMGLIRDAAQDQIRRALRRGAKEAMTLLALELNLSEARLEALASARLAEMVTNVTPATQKAVRDIVVGGIEEGLTTSEIQAQLMQSPEFGAARALRIARTETTAGLEAGAATTYQAARDAGVSFTLEWLSARDASVRDAHMTLDGQRRAPGQSFEVDGYSADRPGGFGVASLDVNCRCTLLPHVED